MEHLLEQSDCLRPVIIDFVQLGSDIQTAGEVVKTDAASAVTCWAELERLSPRVYCGVESRNLVGSDEFATRLDGLSQ